MKQNTKALTLFLLLGSYFTICFAQEFEIPQNVALEKKEDYIKYEKDIIAATGWLEATPLGKDDDKRKLVSAFVLQWITGSPTVSIEINTAVTKIADKNPEMLIMLMAAYTRYALQNNYETDKLKCFTAAMKSVINLYNAGGDVKKNKTIEKAISADKEDKLEGWADENIVHAK